MRHDRLRRLPPEAYCGRAYVHWSLTTQDRRKGWLNETWHATFREVLLHACARYALGCPVYCLMPDHLHLLLVGREETSDQRKAVSFFRKSMTKRMRGTGFAWQRQAYDSVLREKDRARDAFPVVVAYVKDNPERAGLTSEREDWPYSGSLLPGFPDLDWRKEDFWDIFWEAL